MQFERSVQFVLGILKRIITLVYADFRLQLRLIARLYILLQTYFYLFCRLPFYIFCEAHLV